MTRIKGKKVILRNWKTSDAKELTQIMQDNKIPKFTRAPTPYKLKDAKKFIKECKEYGRKGTEVGFAIIDGKNKKIVGSLGIMGINKQCKKAEIGYLLGRKYRGKGFMAEAIQLALGLCFGKLGFNRIVISCSTKNKTSRKVIEKTGAKFEGIQRESVVSGDGKTHNMRIYAILKHEFKGKKYR